MFNIEATTSINAENCHVGHGHNGGHKWRWILTTLHSSSTMVGHFRNLYKCNKYIRKAQTLPMVLQAQLSECKQTKVNKC